MKRDKDLTLFQYCLIEKFEDVYKYFSEIEKQKSELGPYYLFEVHKKGGTNPDYQHVGIGTGIRFGSGKIFQETQKH